MKNSNAFSLVELLVVMGVVAVLSVLAVFGITEVQKNARDTDRKIVVQTIATKLDRIAVNGGSLPGHFKWGDVSATHIVISSEKINFPGGAQRKIVDEDLGPTNETTNSTTDYCFTTQGNKYVVGVRLENGSYYYETNTNAEYSSSNGFYTDPVSGTGPKCIDGNL